MGEATRGYFLEVFSETLDILRTESITHVVIGTIANTCHLGDPWDPGEDIDILMTKEDADRCLRIFPTHRYAVHVRDQTWIYKAAKPNVTIDLIFAPAGRAEMDDEIASRSVTCDFEGLTVPVPCVEDMFVHKSMIDSEEHQGHWYDAMRYLEHVDDWSYLVRRAHKLAPRKVGAALAYAAESGIHVPLSVDVEYGVG